MTCRRHLYICLKCVRISLLEFLKLCSPCKWAYDVDIDSVRSPLSCCNSCKSTDSFFCCRICTLTIITEKSRTGSKVDDASFCLFQVWVACLHIIKYCIQSWIHCQIELFLRMICQCNSGCRSLCIVDQHIDSPKCIDCLFHNIFNNCFIVCACRYVCLYRKYFYSVQSL